MFEGKGQSLTEEKKSWEREIQGFQISRLTYLCLHIPFSNIFSGLLMGKGAPLELTYSSSSVSNIWLLNIFHQSCLHLDKLEVSPCREGLEATNLRPYPFHGDFSLSLITDFKIVCQFPRHMEDLISSDCSDEDLKSEIQHSQKPMQ